MKTPIAPLALIAALGAASYSNTLDAPFVFDDIPNIVLSHEVRDLGAAMRGLPDQPRAVGRLTFSLNHAVHGLDVRGFHLVNLAIHLLAAACVYLLVRVAFRAAGSDGVEGGAALAAFAAGVLFVTHPVQTQAVTYVIQRYALFATLLYVAALLLYAWGRLVRTGSRAIAFHAGSLACAVLAMRTKEIAFTLPLAIALYELLFVKSGWRERVRVLALPLTTLAIIPLTMVSAGTVEALDVPTAVAAGKIGRLEYLLTQPGVIIAYLRLLVLPVGQNVDPDYPLHRTLGWEVALSAALLAAVLAAGVWLAVTGRRRDRPHALISGFGIVLFFLALTVESSIIPITDVMQEHRVYLPSVGAFTAAGAAVALLVERLRSRLPTLPRTAPAVVVVAGLVYGGAAWARNQVWASPVSLWRDAVEKSPNKLRPLLNYAAALRMSGDVDAARQVSIRALAFAPTNSTQAYALGIIHREMGDVERARQMWEWALEANPRNHFVLVALGTLADELGDRQRARAYMEKALDIEPAYDDAHLKLAMILEEAGELEAALAHYETFIRVAPPWRARAAAQVEQMLRARRGIGR